VVTPSPVKITKPLNPKVTPKTWGILTLKPKLAPVIAEMVLLGPGVILVVKA
jgi:hypothetical protein